MIFLIGVQIVQTIQLLMLETTIILGSARFSIRGDSRENMPMVTESNNEIVYNGEVFDINKLTKELNNNINYLGDTRMLLDYLSIDEENIKNINGMFAFAFFNKEKKSLYLGRINWELNLCFIQKNTMVKFIFLQNYQVS